MRSSFLTLSVIAATACSLAAQPLFHNVRSWAPKSYEVERLIPADLDADSRDDVLMLLSNGNVVRAANPAVANGFFLAPEFSNIADMVGVRRDGVCDLVISVSAAHGLAIHGMRPSGGFLTLPSTPTLWSNVQQLRFVDENGPLVAGLEADGRTVRVAQVNLASYSFTELGSATFPQALQDFELSKRAQDPIVHVVGLSASKFQRRQLGGTLISSMGHAFPAGHIEAMPASSAVAWFRKLPSDSTWDFVQEAEGVSTVPISLDLPEFSDLQINGVQATDFNGDGRTDLLFGQDANGDFGALFGQANGYTSAAVTVIRSKSDYDYQQPSSTTGFPASVVGRPDGGTLPGVFHVATDQSSLEVATRVTDPMAMEDGSGLAAWLPQADASYQAFYRPSRKLDVRLFLPENLRNLASALDHRKLHIEVWHVEGLTNGNEITFETATVLPAMHGSFVWNLSGSTNPQGAWHPDQFHHIEIPIGLGSAMEPQLWNDRHAILMTRLGTTGLGASGETLITGSLFTTPIWLGPTTAPGFAPFLDQTGPNPFFDPGIGGKNVDWNTPTGYKDIARLRPGNPVVPGLDQIPEPPPIAGLGDTND